MLTRLSIFSLLIAATLLFASQASAQYTTPATFTSGPKVNETDHFNAPVVEGTIAQTTPVTALPQHIIASPIQLTSAFQTATNSVPLSNPVFAPPIQSFSPFATVAPSVCLPGGG